MGLISLITAVDKNWLIGRHDRMPWHLPAELQHFRETTLDKPVILGRRTYEAIGQPLDKRENIVLTEQDKFNSPDCLVATDTEAALKLAEPAEEIMVAGGRSIYEQFLPKADRIYLTRIEAEFEGDTYFPEVDETNWEISQLKHREADARNDWPFTVFLYERKN